MDTMSGGNNRRYAIFKRSGKFGIDYIPVLDSKNYPEALKFYPDLPRIMRQLHGYTIKIRGRWLRPHYYLNFIYCAVKLSKIATKEGADLIIAMHESFDVLQIVYLASKMSGIPWTIIMQANPIAPPVANPFEGSRIDVVRRIFNVSLPVALLKFLRMRVIIHELLGTLSLSVSNSIASELLYFEPKLRIKVLDPQLGLEDEALHSGSKLESDYDVMFYARLAEQKGVFEIPEIWSLVLKRQPNSKLALAGHWSSEKEKATFERLCEKFGVTKSIFYLGRLPERELFQQLRSVKVLVYPSLMDAFPYVVLESLACGVPVVAYNINPIRYSYKNFDAVVAVEPLNNAKMADAIVDLLRNEQRRMYLSRTGQEFAKKFTWDNAGFEEANSIRNVISFWKKKRKLQEL